MTKNDLNLFLQALKERLIKEADLVLMKKIYQCVVEGGREKVRSSIKAENAREEIVISCAFKVLAKYGEEGLKAMIDYEDATRAFLEAKRRVELCTKNDKYPFEEDE
ncbi:hypothetical protein B0186_04830 [Canicola haemoglobinophilus]|uniref:Uncharacterized protein n=1 Tax=Canicola haemoglobinophilus TaxID=733 RepID=A0A1V4B1N7_9PAST|nr:hypothetical protein [Canicola haemoglobinophilus]OOS01065.1 hypothetical protein B0186_04830 [Canicola haemoglobinophilus]STO60302.1 Uncharacterised protein [Canicola haemoglobinophilus]